MNILIVLNGLLSALFVYLSFVTGYNIGVSDKQTPVKPFIMPNMSKILYKAEKEKEQQIDIEEQKKHNFFD